MPIYESEMLVGKENERTHPDQSDTDSSTASRPEFYRLPEAAAPEMGSALYVNHVDHGWLPVLSQFTDIETDHVVVALGDTDTGAFKTLYHSWYGDYEDVIMDGATLLNLYSDDWKEMDVEPADDIVTGLPRSTPGESNLTTKYNG